MSENISLAWKILYGEDLEPILDPNKPENAPHYKALRKAKKEKLQRLISGPGAAITAGFVDKIKKINLKLISDHNNTACNCPASFAIREIQVMLNLLIDIENILAEQD